jgi:hypothetical protein
MTYLTSKCWVQIKCVVYCRTEGHYEIFIIFLYILLPWSQEHLETARNKHSPEDRYGGRSVCPYVTGRSVTAVFFVGYFTTLSEFAFCSFEWKDQ